MAVAALVQALEVVVPIHALEIAASDDDNDDDNDDDHDDDDDDDDDDRNGRWHQSKSSHANPDWLAKLCV